MISEAQMYNYAKHKKFVVEFFFKFKYKESLHLVTFSHNW